MFDRLDDTIVAISSPPGIGIRGIVRLSGPRAFELAEGVFMPADGISLSQLPGHQRRWGQVRFAGPVSLPAQAYAFRAPASYTRQDLVELHTLGSPPLLGMLLESLIHAGGRVAEPGEFTGRAFFLGALDLTAVEGVASTIHAQTDAQLRASQALLHGSLSRRTRQMRDELADLLALLEASIDFAEEPIEFVSLATVGQAIRAVAHELDEMLDHSQSVERLQVLPRIVLVGPPNAGKSTLFNRLTGMDRAIASAVAGTTRDVITAPLVLAGGEAILCDTAGIFADRFSAVGSDELEQAIASATDRAIGTADLLLVVIDASHAAAQASISRLSESLGNRPYQVVLAKADLVREANWADADGVLALVSAVTGEGIETLRTRMDKALFAAADTHGSELISLTQRHRGALHDAREALQHTTDLLHEVDPDHVPTELLALELRHAVNALSLLLGDVTTEDLLARIFSRFCIGK